MGESPFILNATVKEHLSNERSNDPQSAEIIDRIEDDLYCDDLTSGDFSIAATKAIKKKSIDVFRKAGIELHKWHSNVPELENQVGRGVNQTEGETSFAKQQLGVKEAENKILGILWDKMGDLLGVRFPKMEEAARIQTKRAILKFLASIYDPLGIASPVTLLGKFFYRQACNSKISRDEKLPEVSASISKKG